MKPITPASVALGLAASEATRAAWASPNDKPAEEYPRHLIVESHFRPVPLAFASRLINHGPTVLVTSAAGTRRNVMAAAWSMPVEFDPPRIAIVIDKRTFTHELVAASGAFGICVPGGEISELTHAVGSESGRDVDKFSRHGIQARPSELLGVPIIEAGCLAWLECKLIPEPHTEAAYDTCFANVVAAAADARAFADGRWVLTNQAVALQSIHHLGGGNFTRGALIRS